jgi:2-polyprenyl-3-methyl-5-hydroxy-6-metoxy-1,4-benzoquinol methylase
LLAGFDSVSPRISDLPVPTTLTHPGGELRIDQLPTGRSRISVQLADPDAFAPQSEWETGYPVELIASVLEVKGPAYVCDEIMREEDPGYVERNVRLALLGYFDESAFAGKRLLDLGSGCGSSSLVLARLLDGAEIVGVELVDQFVQLARERASYRGADNVSFQHSPNGQQLPEGIGRFDFIVLSAVFEHLLPEERKSLLPLLWDHLNLGGVLFINQLPHRFSPVEVHTTGLPLINYMPDWLAHRVAFASRRREGREGWEELLRAGIRGGTAHEIVGILEHEEGLPVLLEATRLGMKDRIDLWFALSSTERWSAAKRAIKAVLKTVKRTTGVTFVPELSLAIRKSHPVPEP